MTVTGSGRLVQIPYTFKDFNQITLSNTFQANITQADTFTVEITIDDNVEQYLQVTQEGSELHLSLEKNRDYRNVTLRVNITLPNLESLFVHDASSAELANFTFGSAFELTVLDASQVSGTVYGVFHCKVSDASQVSINGSGAQLEIDARDASIANFGRFLADNATIQLSDASTATVNVS
jgi:hypothetical protein